MAPAAVPPATAPAPAPDAKSAASNSLLPNRGRLIVELPTDAKLYIDDQAMKTTAEVRSFQTPDLAQGQAYYYIVRAEMVRDGQPVSETRRVTVKAGEVSRVEFKERDMVAQANSK